VTPSPRDPDYRPLLPLAPRFTPHGMELDVGSRTVAISGPPTQLGAITALCDGRHPAAEIAATVEGVGPTDLADLLEALADAGAVVDTAEAWRVFHCWSGSDSMLGRSLDRAALVAMLDDRYEQPGLQGVSTDLAPEPTRIDPLLARRASSGDEDPPRPATFGELSAILRSMYAGDGAGGRPVPSGGGLYPLVIHALVRKPLGRLAPGTWWYDPAADRVELIAKGAPDVPAAFTSEPHTQARVAVPEPVVLISADVAHGARKYASRAYRLALLEAGAAMQNAYLAATDLDLPIRAMLGIDDERASELLRLPDGTVALLALLIGR
jgi:SagB-type dehydrogenase family enzyme